MKQIVIYTTFLSLIMLASCSPYEKGPSMTLKKAEKKIVGTWEIVDLLINDKTDHLNLIKEKDFEYTYHKDGTYSIKDKSKKESEVFYKSRWSFKEEKTILVIEHYIKEDNTEISVRLEFVILKLTDKELWIKDNESTKQNSESNYIIERHYNKK